MSSTRSIVPPSGPIPRLVAACVYGDLLGGRTELDRVELALVADERPEQVPWMSRPAHLEALAVFLRFDKLPLSWQWRPAAWPVWNHKIDRALRFWARERHADRAALEAWPPVISKRWWSTRRPTRTRSWRNGR